MPNTYGKAETQKGKAETNNIDPATHNIETGAKLIPINDFLPTSELEDFFGPVFSSYSRQDALADGMLVDVSEMAQEAGFSIPVAVTTAVWHDCIDWPKDSEQGFGPSIDGRPWDVLKMAYFKIRSTRDQSEDLLYQLGVIHTDIKPDVDEDTMSKVKTLKINIGPGDKREPVLTIMQPNEY